MKRLTVLSLLVLAAAACGDTVTGPDAVTNDLLVTSYARTPRISICHYRVESDTYKAKMIGAGAEADHRSHGDGMVGEAVSRMAGYEFGADCQPVAVGPGPCLQAAIEAYELEFACSPPWDWDAGGPWFVTQDDGNQYEVLTDNRGNGGIIEAPAAVVNFNDARCGVASEGQVTYTWSGGTFSQSDLDQAKAYLESLVTP